MKQQPVFASLDRVCVTVSLWGRRSFAALRMTRWLRMTWSLRLTWCLPAAFLITACAATPPIDTSYRSRGQDSRVMYIVIHATEGDFPHSLQILTQGEVSSHYLVRDEPPTVHRLVDEDRRAWHAGVSSWKGSTQLNAASVGIEIVNLVGQPYPPAQIDAVVALVKDIALRHRVPPERILGHSDIAPQRKVDPGPLFPWRRLAEEGLVPWPDEAMAAGLLPGFAAALPDAAWFQQRLAQLGFAVPTTAAWDEETRRVLRAFQMRYRPASAYGVADAETAALLQVAVSPSGLKMLRTAPPR
jgi:N-acetylmuramoyl-L-alanine amidase